MLRLLITIVASPLLLAGANASIAAWQFVESTKGYRMERIEFEKGSKPGQLYHERNPVLDVVPRALSIGPNGELYVIERGLNRLQTFSPEGRFVSALSIEEVAQRVPGGLKKTPVALINVFPTGPYRATVLMRVKAVAKEPSDYILLSLRAEGNYIDNYVELRQPAGPAKPVEMSFLDREGFLWVFTDKWIVFSPDGQPLRRLGERGNYVDSDGRLYIPGDNVTIIDRLGKVLATAHPVPPGWTKINGGEGRTVLFAWERNETTTKTGNIDEQPNSITLFRLDNSGEELRRIRRVELPPTRLSYPGPNPDTFVPIQRYIRELGTLHGRYFYILGDSKNKYWIDRIDLSR